MNKAKALWKQWWCSTEGEYTQKGRPVYCDGEWGDLICFFCDKTLNPGEHAEDCVYLEVKQMAEEEGW